MKIVSHITESPITINQIFENQELWLNNGEKHSGKDEYDTGDFYLTEDIFNDLRSQIDYSRIKYNPNLTKDQFEIICKSGIDKETLRDFKSTDIFFACVTTNRNALLKDGRFGQNYVDFDLDFLKTKKSRFLLIKNVFYGKDPIKFGQYFYDYLLMMIEYYCDSFHEFNIPFNVDDNKEKLLAKCFVYLRFFMKPKDSCQEPLKPADSSQKPLVNYEIEEEIRILFDFNVYKQCTMHGFMQCGTNFSECIQRYDVEKYLKNIRSECLHIAEVKNILQDYIDLKSDEFIREINPETIEHLVLDLSKFESLNLKMKAKIPVEKQRIDGTVYVTTMELSQ